MKSENREWLELEVNKVLNFLFERPFTKLMLHPLNGTNAIFFVQFFDLFVPALLRWLKAMGSTVKIKNENYVSFHVLIAPTSWELTGMTGPIFWLGIALPLLLTKNAFVPFPRPFPFL